MAFHPYPQVIRGLFNAHRFGPPWGLTPTSTCPWIDHSASGLQPLTSRPFQTRFRFGSPSRVNLASDHNSQAHYAKGSPSPWTYVHRAPNDCRQAVSGSISLPSLGFFSPFPHGTCALSVWQEYLALEGGPPIFTQDNTCPELLAWPLLSPTNLFSGTGLSPSLADLSRSFP